jgi:glycosyltransferase involved in cell wall biosynthesis
MTFRFVGKRTPSLNNFLVRVEKEVPSLKCECTGFIPYSEVAKQLAVGTIGIVPYEESTGVHCAFVAKTVEYLALGLPVVCTPLKSALRYFGNEPLVRFSEFDGRSFGEKILSWLEEPLERRQALAALPQAHRLPDVGGRADPAAPPRGCAACGSIPRLMPSSCAWTVLADLPWRRK